MKKGLRPGLADRLVVGRVDSNSRPDEEGIKTQAAGHGSGRDRIPTADLMKKGLRQQRTARIVRELEFQQQT